MKKKKANNILGIHIFHGENLNFFIGEKNIIQFSAKLSFSIMYLKHKFGNLWLNWTIILY